MLLLSIRFMENVELYRWKILMLGGKYKLENQWIDNSIMLIYKVMERIVNKINFVKRLKYSF